MRRPSQKSYRHALPALVLLAGVLVSLGSGCASKSTTSEAEPEIARQTDSVSVFAGTSQEVQKRPEESVLTVLQGRTSGAIVSMSPSGAISVLIRGAGSFYGASQPLYVVDGVPVRPGPGGTLAGLNPYDIVSIRVLKGPPETTLYGVRGANGVVVIKTRQPDL